MKSDPTREEILSVIPSIYKNEEGFADSFEIALYYFASLYHGGQSTNLYSILCNSPYSPGRLENFDSCMENDSFVADNYYEIENRFTIKHKTHRELG